MTMQLTHHARWNRYDVQPPFEELDVIGMRPAAVTGRALSCEGRVNQFGRVRRCPYYHDCAENCQRGGAVLCERLVIGIVGDGTLVEV